MPESWKVSLHGGHSGEFCAHGADTLPAMLDAAVAFGYTTFGVTAHSPRSQERFLYPDEIELDLKPNDLSNTFSNYAKTCKQLANLYEDRLEVLCGAEIEVVPEATYVTDAASLRERHELDFVVGSVHWVGGLPIDTSRDDFKKAVAVQGGLEPFILRYYELVGEMVEKVRPEVIGHLDLPRLYADAAAELESASVRGAVGGVLERALAAESIIDLNVRAMSKGLSTPFPAPWIVQLASQIGVTFCFGDDSHSVASVGGDMSEGREYLLSLGVNTITKLAPSNGEIVKESVPL